MDEIVVHNINLVGNHMTPEVTFNVFLWVLLAKFKKLIMLNYTSFDSKCRSSLTIINSTVHRGKSNRE